MKRLLIGAPLALALMGGVATASMVDDDKKKPEKVKVERTPNTYQVNVTGMT